MGLFDNLPTKKYVPIPNSIFEIAFYFNEEDAEKSFIFLENVEQCCVLENQLIISFNNFF